MTHSHTVAELDPLAGAVPLTLGRGVVGCADGGATVVVVRVGAAVVRPGVVGACVAAVDAAGGDVATVGVDDAWAPPAAGSLRLSPGFDGARLLSAPPAPPAPARGNGPDEKHGRDGEQADSQTPHARSFRRLTRLSPEGAGQRSEHRACRQPGSAASPPTGGLQSAHRSGSSSAAGVNEVAATTSGLRVSKWISRSYTIRSAFVSGGCVTDRGHRW